MSWGTGRTGWATVPGDTTGARAMRRRCGVPAGRQQCGVPGARAGRRRREVLLEARAGSRRYQIVSTGELNIQQFIPTTHCPLSSVEDESHTTTQPHDINRILMQHYIATTSLAVKQMVLLSGCCSSLASSWPRLIIVSGSTCVFSLGIMLDT